MGVPTLLGQQELLEAAPARRLIVPEGHCAWWAVDPSTTRAAAAYVANGASGVLRGASTAPFAPLSGSARLSEILRQTGRFVTRLAGEWPAPGVVLVEQPSGKFDKPTLAYAVGVTLVAVFDALFEFYGRVVAVETVTSSHWKLIACGRGNLYKPTREKLGRAPVFSDYAVARWACLNGYAGSSWDECDALGMAECARREIGLEER